MSDWETEVLRKQAIADADAAFDKYAALAASEKGAQIFRATEKEHHAEIARLESRLTEAEAEVGRLTIQNKGLGQLLAHVHLHLTNDEDFGADELETDIRNLNGGEWVDTETILIDIRAGFERERLRAEAAEAKLKTAEAEGRTLLACLEWEPGGMDWRPFYRLRRDSQLCDATGAVIRLAKVCRPLSPELAKILHLREDAPPSPSTSEKE